MTSFSKITIDAEVTAGIDQRRAFVEVLGLAQEKKLPVVAMFHGTPNTPIRAYPSDILVDVIERWYKESEKGEK